ncbi:MAG: ATP-binding cassette domain-containing protein [Halothiobacillaceae bacterium]|jgi:ATP-binding cassette subfamily F protein uup
MPLLTVDHLGFSVGTRTLLSDVAFTVEPGERIALIGRNGEGKSTLLRILTGEQRPDEGEIRLAPGARAAYLQQDPRLESDATVYDTVLQGLGDLHDILLEYQTILARLESGDEAAAMERLSALQHELDARHGWDVARRVDEVISRLDLDPKRKVRELSGGAQRRVLLAQALVQEPDLLLLDEPTNHLDIASIEWLEGFIRDFRGAVLFITHDRAFLQRLANRILELDRGQLTSWPGDWDNYLRRREEREHAEAQQNAEFDKFLAQEEVWIRQGIKARRTRNEGRVRRLMALRRERAERVNRQGRVEISLGSSPTSGKLVVETERASKSFAGRPVVKDLSIRIQRGDRIGLVGPNGVGKSTLLKLLLGEIQPDSGTVRIGTQLNIAYFDQHRAQLNPDWTAIENLCDGGDRIEVHGENMHGIGYLQRFLFTPDRARTKVSALSGGERNRLLLARLLARPANLLVLDEPTNDLDLETLEVLEQALLDYDGTLLVVSHDRAFLDNVVTSLLAFEGEGKVREVVGGYADWIKIREQEATRSALAQKENAGVKADAPTVAKAGGEASVSSAAKPRAKLSFKDQRELDQIPARIDALEAEQAELTARSSDPAFYQGDQATIKALLDRLAAIGQELEAAYARWAELDAMSG